MEIQKIVNDKKISIFMLIMSEDHGKIYREGGASSFSFLGISGNSALKTITQKEVLYELD